MSETMSGLDPTPSNVKISIQSDKKHGKAGVYALPREHINLWDLLPRHGYIYKLLEKN